MNEAIVKTWMYLGGLRWHKP